MILLEDYPAIVDQEVNASFELNACHWIVEAKTKFSFCKPIVQKFHGKCTDNDRMHRAQHQDWILFSRLRESFKFVSTL